MISVYFSNAFQEPCSQQLLSCMASPQRSPPGSSAKTSAQSGLNEPFGPPLRLLYLNRFKGDSCRRVPLANFKQKVRPSYASVKAELGGSSWIRGRCWHARRAYVHHEITKVQTSCSYQILISSRSKPCFSKYLEYVHGDLIYKRDIIADSRGLEGFLSATVKIRHPDFPGQQHQPQVVCSRLIPNLHPGFRGPERMESFL
jgi:hypothetical protein